ncbi:fatty acyl-CoA synthetase [Oceanospirillum sp.]|uniref:fatty acyl-CoA synthetase n=1 Tax=Oceanospirillum sp. TaxID=2021254 RepID=UPI003A8CD0DA
MTTMDMAQVISQATRNTLGAGLERSARRNNNKVALQYADRYWTFAEFNLAVNRVANQLIRSGLQKGDRVAAYGKNSDAYLLLFLACAKAGLIHVPVNFALVKDELLYILNQSGAKALFSDSSLKAHIDEVYGQAELALHGSLHAADPATGSDEKLDILALALDNSVNSEAPDIELSDSDVVQILYTSGTTSDPKGAMHTHRSLMSEYNSCINHLDLSSDDRGLAALPLYHSAQMHVFSMPALLQGSFSYLIDTPTPDQILRLLKEEKLNSFFAPPTVWIALLRHDDFVDTELQHLKKLYYGASIMPEPIVHELEQRLPESGLYNCYGQSEIAPLATVLTPAEHKARPSSCGRPVSSVCTRIVDPVTGEDCAPGQQGELVHQSPHLMVGYWNKPEETAEAFKDGWFHSGDLGIQDEEGFIYIVDRIKDVVNTGGVLVASRDVEEALYTHASIAEVAVIGVPDEKWIEAIAAVVVLKPGVEVDETILIRHAKEHLAAFKVPKQVHFVDQLPKNTAGKLLKRTLRDQFAQID